MNNKNEAKIFNLNVSFNKNCKDAEILQPNEVLINNAPRFFSQLREYPDKIFKGIKIPTIEEAAQLEHGELPTIIGTGSYNKTRSNENLIEWNRLVWLDIDCVNKDFKKSKSLQYFELEIKKLKGLLVSESNIYAYCLSKSGKGLRVIYKIPDVHDITDVAKYYSDVYMAFKKVIDTFLIQNNLSFFEVDTQAKDISHAFAIVSDPDSMCFNQTIDSKIFKQLLSDYELKEKKFKSKQKAIINPDTIANLKIDKLRLNSSIRLNQYTTRFQAANVLSYLFGADGLDYYLSIVEGSKKAEYKSFYNHGLNKRNSYKDDEINLLLLSADKLFDLKLPKQYIKEDSEPDKTNNQYTFKNYLSELKQDVINIIEKDKLIILDAPTNTGKTTLSKELSQYYKIDFVAPTQAIVKQQEKDIKIVIGNNILTDEDKAANILAAPYESIGKLSERNSEMLIVDEAHHLIEDYLKGFRKEAVRRILDSFSRYKHVVLLSGTPDGLSKIEGFNIYKFRKEETKKVKLHDYLNFSDVVKKSGLLAIYLNDKDKGIEYKKKLVNDFDFNESEIVLINGDEKEGDVYKKLLSDQTLDNNIKCIIATKLIADGVNINNEYDKVNIYFPEVFKVSYNEIKQFSTRFRKANIELFTSSFPDNSTVKTQWIPTLNELEVAATKVTESLKSDILNNKYYYKSFENLNVADSYFRDVKEYGITYDKIKKVVVDEMFLIRKYLENENLLFRNINYIRKDVLNGLDIEYIDSLPIDIDEDTRLINGATLKNKKEAFKSNIENFETLLTLDNLTKGQKSLVDSYKKMLQYGVNKTYAADLIKNTKNKHNINQHIKSLKFNINRKLIEEAKVNIDESDSVSIMIVLMDIYSTFKGSIGKEFTPEQLNNFVNNAIDNKKDKFVDLSYLVVNYNKVMEWFNIIFELVLKVTKDESRKSIRKYLFNGIKDDKYFKVTNDVFESSNSLFDID